jgi:hypothetical protein
VEDRSRRMQLWRCFSGDSEFRLVTSSDVTINCQLNRLGSTFGLSSARSVFDLKSARPAVFSSVAIRAHNLNAALCCYLR